MSRWAIGAEQGTPEITQQKRICCSLELYLEHGILFSTFDRFKLLFPFPQRASNPRICG